MSPQEIAQTSTEELVKLSFFVDIAKAIASAKTGREVLASVMEQIGRIFAPSNWSLLLFDRKKTELVFKVVVGKACQQLQGHRIPADTGIAGWILANKQGVITDDVRTDPRFSGEVDEFSGFQTKSIIGVPLMVDGNAIGVIELVNKTNGECFTAFEMKILSTIADFAALGLERAYYFSTIRRMSLEDSLTGVGNRRLLDQVLKQEVERASRYKHSLSLLMLDIDAFKAINDNHGHQAGDEVLKALASILRGTVRRVDTVARYGGDEFAVIMPDTSEAMAHQVYERILRGVEAYSLSGEGISFSISAGFKTGRGEEAVRLLDEADTLMYRKKVEKRPQNIEQYLMDTP